MSKMFCESQVGKGHSQFFSSPIIVFLFVFACYSLEKRQVEERQLWEGMIVFFCLFIYLLLLLLF